MKLTPDQKQELFLLYHPGSAIAALEKLEWDRVRFHEEEPDDDEWSKKYSRENEEKRLLLRAQYKCDLLSVEQVAFQKGVEAVIKWFEGP